MFTEDGFFRSTNHGLVAGHRTLLVLDVPDLDKVVSVNRFFRYHQLITN